MRLGPMAVLHAIVDGVVDNYTLIDAEVSADLDDIETGVFSGADMDSSTIYRLKREVLEFRRAAAPLAAPLMALHEDEGSHVEDPELRLRFRDVSDHLQAVIDHVESYDRLLTDVLGAHLAQVTVQQNSDMRRISAWVAIAAVPDDDRRHLRHELRLHARADREHRHRRRASSATATSSCSP